MGEIDKVTWYAIGLALTTLGLVLSYLRYRKKGFAAGARGVAWSLLPLALALTGTLKLAAQIVDDIGHWALHLVFSPVVWLGIALAGVSLVLFVVSGWMGRRGGQAPEPGRLGATSSTTPAGKAAVSDDDLADIEAILRKHGIK